MYKLDGKDMLDGLSTRRRAIGLECLSHPFRMDIKVTSRVGEIVTARPGRYRDEQDREYPVEGNVLLIRDGP